MVNKSIGGMNVISKDITEIKVGVARIEEHIKKMNEDIVRHDKCIENLQSDVSSNKIELAKLGAIAGVSGGVTGGIVLLITKLAGF